MENGNLDVVMIIDNLIEYIIIIQKHQEVFGNFKEISQLLQQ